MRWAVGAGGVVRNLTKNFFAHLRYNVAFAVLAALGLLWLHLGPWLGRSLRHRVGARWLCGCARLPTDGVCGDGKAHEDRRRLCVAASGGERADGVYLLRSTVLTLARGGVEWRGTFYPLAELKRNR